MSISSTTSRNDYLGNDSTPVYPYTFRVFRKQDIRVIEKNLSGVEFVLVLDIDYTVSGVNNPAGGNITRTAGNLPTGYKWTIRRVLQLKQETDIRNQGPFLPEIHENQFDRDVMIAQQLTDDIARSVRNPETISTSEFSPVLPTNVADTAGAALVVNSGKNGWSMGVNVANLDLARIFAADTLANLKVLSATTPSTLRMGFATDLNAWCFYTGNVGIGDQGWIVGPGAGTPVTEDPI